MIFKKSFTLSEIMIALAVLGIIVAACVPIILNMSPNKNAIMIRKAYYTTEQIISDLINDENYFPDGDLSNSDDYSIAGVDNPSLNYKLRCLFASKLNLDTTNSNFDNLSVACEGNDEGTDDVILYTHDGMVWNLSNMKNLSDSQYYRIDISTSRELDKTLYSIDEGHSQPCINYGNGWGANPCGVVSDHAHKFGKAAFFIDKNGNISLIGDAQSAGMLSGQPEVQKIINGSTSLMGK